MRPYNVEVFTPDFTLVGNTNVNTISYKEDYISSDDNSITVFPVNGIKKQDYIRISRGKEEYAGIVTEIAYGTNQSKQLQVITFKPLVELFNTGFLFDVNKQGQGTLEQFMSDAIEQVFMDNADTKQNIMGLQTEVTSGTAYWGFHITPAESGGHYNIVNLSDSIIIPALQKYSILTKCTLDVQNKHLIVSIGKAEDKTVIIESDLPNIIKKNVVIKQVSTDVNKLILYNASADYTESVTYYLHSDLGYDTKDTDRMLPVVCAVKAVTADESISFTGAAQREAANQFANKTFSNLIELTMSSEDALVNPKELAFGQLVTILSDGVSYQSILTGKEVGSNTKLIFGTVRLDLTKILRRNSNG